MSRVALSYRLSVSRLRHVFTKEVGLPPASYLRELRMIEARRLLKTSSLAIKEIGWRVGIADASHLVRYFTRASGMSPTRYRTTIRVRSGDSGD